MKRTCSLFAQLSQAVLAQPQAKSPEFEVADVKVSKSNNPEQGKGGMTGPDRSAQRHPQIPDCDL